MIETKGLPSGRMLGYARVSTFKQDEAVQVEALIAAGCDPKLIYRETESGARTNRPQLRKVIAALKRGDVLVITRLDRLARSTRDLLNVLDEISEAGAAFKSLGDPWADTTTPHGELMITVLAGLATFERHLILARTSEGRKRAKARGQHMGRPRKITSHQTREAIKRHADGESYSDIARSFNLSHQTIMRAVSAGA